MIIVCIQLVYKIIILKNLMY